MQKPRRHQYLHHAWAKVASVPMILTAFVVFAGGTGWTVLHSFTSSRLLPRADFVGLDQYERLWASRRWLESMENIVLFGLCSTVFTLVVGFTLAALLDRKIRFENAFRTILLYPLALSSIVSGLAWQWILNPDLGLQNVIQELGWESFTFNPLVDPGTAIFGLLIAGLWQGTGLVMCIILVGMRSVDSDIWKVARVDGIGTVKTYLLVILPMLRPFIATSLVIISSTFIKLYDLVVAQTNGGPGIATQVPSLYVIDYLFKAQNLGQGFAASTMMLISVAIILLPWIYLEYGRGRIRG